MEESSSSSFSTSFPSTPVTSTWNSRSRERCLLTSLLRPHRCCNLAIYGSHGQGKTTLLLDVLTQNRVHFAYSDMRISDKWMVKRLTEQILDPRIGPLRFRQLCTQQKEGVEWKLPKETEKRGRKRKSEETSEIPQHPDAAMIDDTKAASSLTTPATAESDHGLPLVATAAQVGGIPFQSSTRSQLTELVRTICGLRHSVQMLGNQPESLYLVLDNAHQLGDPSFLSSLLALTQHTQYPVGLILISTSLPSIDGGASGYYSLPHHLSDRIIPITFAPYSPKDLADIIGTALWQTNKHVAEAFCASSLLTPSQSAIAMTYFLDLLERLIEIFADQLSSERYTLEKVVRRFLPRLLQVIRQLITTNPAALRSSDAASEFSGRVLQLLERDLQMLRSSIGLAEEYEQRGETRGGEETQKDTASSSSVRKKQALTSANGSPTASLPVSAVDSFNPLLQLSRTSKLLLLSSFLASYNPPSSDTALFTHDRKASNRRGKSAALERKRKNFDAKSSEAQAQVSQTMKGPNAAPMERVIAIYQAINEETDRMNSSTSSSSSLSGCYAQLKNLIATHYLKQVTTGSRGKSSGSDLLNGVKLQCLITKEQMELVCDSIDPTTTQAKMGEKITLGMYLFDGARK